MYYNPPHESHKCVVPAVLLNLSSAEQTTIRSFNPTTSRRVIYLSNDLTLREHDDFPRQFRTRFPADEFHPDQEVARAHSKGRWNTFMCMLVGAISSASVGLVAVLNGHPQPRGLRNQSLAYSLVVGVSTTSCKTYTESFDGIA